MASKQPRNRMTQQEKEEWDELYQYVKSIMGYDNNQALSKQMILRLKGMLHNKFMENKKVEGTANYSYKTILNTFKICSVHIKKAIAKTNFKDEMHKFNYILKIVEQQVNDVYIRMQQAQREEEYFKNNEIPFAQPDKAQYQKKTEELPDWASTIW